MQIDFLLLSILIFSLDNVHRFTTEAASVGASIRCYKGSFENYSVFSLCDPVALLNCSCYDPARKTVFYTFGFYGEAKGPTVKGIVEAYLTLPFNIILVDWERQASGGILGNYLGYLTAVRNTIIVGKQFGQALIKLIKAGLKSEKILLIGFSLGASFMGSAAREVQIIGQNVTRVIGLDPARPFFDGFMSLRGLDASSANSVIIIHTNPKALGTVENAGTVDIWPNCGSSIQPGCGDGTGGKGIWSPENTCSHNRAWLYYIESLLGKDTFIARRAKSCDTWNKEGETISLDNISLSAHGIYFLNTNSKPLYGRGMAGSIPDK